MSARGGGGGYGGGASPLGGYGPPSRMPSASATFGPISFPPDQPWFPLGSFDLFRFATPFGTFGLIATPLVMPNGGSQRAYGFTISDPVSTVVSAGADVVTGATNLAATLVGAKSAKEALAQQQRAANPCVMKLDAKLAALDAKKIGWGKSGHKEWKAQRDATQAKRDSYAMNPMSCPEVASASAAEQQAALLAAEDAKSAASRQETMLWVGGGVLTVALLSAIALAARRSRVAVPVAARANPRRTRSRRRSR